MKYYIQTLGCAMNYSDSERVAACLEKLGYKRAENWEETDLYIFNTCSVRQKGEDRVYGQLKNLERLKSRNPRLLVGLTGCMVRSTSSRNSEKEVRDDILKLVDCVDFVFRITDAHKIGEVMAEAEPQMDLPQLEESGLKDYLKIKPKYSTQFQAFVPIQIGCDKYCTYCIVPYARGREQSRPMNDILAECRALVEQGCKEITLVGQTVNSYGLSALDKANALRGHGPSAQLPLRWHGDPWQGAAAKNPRLAGVLSEASLQKKSGQFEGVKDPFVKLLTEIDKLQELGLNRVRFISPHPRDYTDALIEAHATLKTLTPHFHLPVQAGDDEVLKRMNRQYTAEKYKDIIKKIRARLPDASITTDIIVGFCGETDEEFERTVKLYEEIRWDMAYLARYSPRRGTVSMKAFKDDVSRKKKSERWHRLNDILEECCLEYHQKMVGRTLEVLVEKYNEHTGECEGKSRENKVIQFPGNPNLVGTIVKIKGVKALDWLIKGELVKRNTALVK